MTLQIKLAALWTVVMFNMVFADILTLFSPGSIAELATGTIEGVTMTEPLLLLAAVFIEIPVLMIILSLVLQPRPNRVAQLIAAPVTILFVVGGGSLKAHYLFLGGIEVLVLIWIIWIALRDMAPVRAARPA